ncbi:MAG: hypothetical protein JXR14_03705 [Paracoccaceae bacterium]
MRPQRTISRHDACCCGTGDAVIFQPFGGQVAGPMHKEKGLLTADIGVDAARTARRKFDVAGHYARPDVFRLTENRKPQSPIGFE